MEIKKETGHFDSFDGTPIYYEVRGEGQPLVLVYGIACLMNHWSHQISYFSTQFKVITFDIRGHHKSNPVSNLKHLKLEHIAEDIHLLLKYLNIQRAHFAGHSFGVPSLVEFSGKYPNEVLSMSLINGFAKNPLLGGKGNEWLTPIYHMIRAQYEMNPDIWNTVWRLAVDNPISMYLAALAGGFNINLTHFKDIEIYARGVARMDLRIFITMFEEVLAFDGEYILDTINFPVLIIAGEKDNITPISFQKTMHDKIKDSEFVLVPYGSHCTQLDFPDYINLKIKDFLQRNSSQV